MAPPGLVPVSIRPVSPSQIATWYECQRKWAWRHIAKIVLPPHKSAAQGTDTHSQLEEYLGGGALDWSRPSAYFADSALPLLPPPLSKGMQLEHHFTFQSAGGYIYHGYMDVVGPDSSIFPGISSLLAEGNLDLIPFVSDHKTTSNFTYAKTEADLRTDPQGVIYAKAVFSMYPSAMQADLIWTYMATKGARKAKRVHLRVLRGDVEKEFERIELAAAEIAATHLASTNPLDLPATLSACGGYGGCPYRANCTDLSTLNPEGKKMSESTQSMFDALTQKLPAAERPASDPLGWLTAAKDPGPGKPSADLLSSLLIPSSAAPTQTVPQEENDVPINPPGEAQPVSELSLKPAPLPGDAAAKRARAPRRTKEQMAEARAQEAAPKADTYVSEGATIPAPALTLSAPPIPEGGFVLFIDAYPGDGEQYTRAETLFALAAAKVKNELGFDDYRMIDYKGGGIFSALVEELSAQVTGNIVIDTRTPEGNLCVARLTSKATRIGARGIR